MGWFRFIDTSLENAMAIHVVHPVLEEAITALGLRQTVPVAKGTVSRAILERVARKAERTGISDVGLLIDDPASSSPSNGATRQNNAGSVRPASLDDPALQTPDTQPTVAD